MGMKYDTNKEPLIKKYKRLQEQFGALKSNRDRLLSILESALLTETGDDEDKPTWVDSARAAIRDTNTGKY